MTRTFASATFKLTAYYMAIIMVVCIMFSAAIYHFATRELYHGLSSQSQRIVSQYPGFNFAPALRSTRDYSDASHRILLNLTYVNIFVLVLSGFAAYGLARRTLQPIQESHEQQKRFTADVSHELRTPLTALTMSTQVALLDEKASKKDLQEALASNLEEANKLENLINSLLRLTRLEAAELRHGFTAIDGAALLQEVVAEAEPRALAKDVTLRNQIKGTLPLYGDRGSLHQLFAILLDNALKYSSPNSSIRLRAASQDGLSTITIEDDGIGIKADALPHIFDRFYRADAARAGGTVAGFGLGLSIAKHIADAHQGAIRISSSEGRGTTVTTELPAQET